MKKLIPILLLLLIAVLVLWKQRSNNFTSTKVLKDLVAKHGPKEFGRLSPDAVAVAFQRIDTVVSADTVAASAPFFAAYSDSSISISVEGDSLQAKFGIKMESKLVVVRDGNSVRVWNSNPLVQSDSVIFETAPPGKKRTKLKNILLGAVLGGILLKLVQLVAGK